MKNQLNYKNAPLPFQGQKRGFLKLFSKSLASFPSDATYVDLFGGSGLLSRTVKDIYPNATVVYNDYDDFSKRLHSISRTNDLLAELRALLVRLPDKHRLPSFDKDKVLKLVKNHQNKYGFVDFVTLSSSILFSGKYVNSVEELEKQTMYNRIRKSDIPKADSYLNGLDVVSMHYKELYELYKEKNNVVFLLDPPYLSTDTKSYNSDGYWQLKDYLDVLNVLDNDRYFYFTSNKSHLVELCQWFGDKFNANPFKGATKLVVTNSVNYSSKYEDIMLFKS